MPRVHRNTDSRFCDGKTIVIGQSTVFVNNLLWAVEGDPNDHCGGNLIAQVKKTVLIEGKYVICAIGDKATPDDGPGCLGPIHPTGPTNPSQGSHNTFVYGGTGGGTVT